MNPDDVALVTGAIKKYYLDCYDKIPTPENILEREFGYQMVNGDSMIRHLSYADERVLRVMLVGTAPSDVYCSNACYLFPALPMKEKSWKSANLIFDIDAKDLALPCRTGHSIAICAECRHVSAADTAKCTACSSSKVTIRSLPCTKCTDAALNEVVKLREILVDDLRIDDNSIKVYFSGNEGFHVHVVSNKFEEFGSRERAELVDYVMFRGAIPEAYGVPRAANAKLDLPGSDDMGWRGRFIRKFTATHAKQAAKNGYTEFQKTLSSANIGAKIDPQVTTDIHRIFRMPGSINGKSGLAKILVPDDSKFNPYIESCLIDSRKVTVTAECPHKFTLGGRRFGPYLAKETSVELYAAVYMICKGFATTQA